MSAASMKARCTIMNSAKLGSTARHEQALEAAGKTPAASMRPAVGSRKARALPDISLY
ncbi:hypothetical protein [Acidilobus sp. 7A]|uniref:hypothetical protein n=1 Tax=Acidilobus sp. 7A TaxID=1577685 RepID=UPI001B3BC627|nr:hypothetical protein [Acidilobus sp. 7A]